MIAGGVIAGGWIIYNMIQNDPEARRALKDAKGKMRCCQRLFQQPLGQTYCRLTLCACTGQAKGAWSETKGQAKDAYYSAKGDAKQATS